MDRLTHIYAIAKQLIGITALAVVASTILFRASFGRSDTLRRPAAPAEGRA